MHRPCAAWEPGKSQEEAEEEEICMGKDNLSGKTILRLELQAYTKNEGQGSKSIQEIYEVSFSAI
jgi:hypothetical protein